jgi:DNA-binding CsgD family transcriptional regulator
MPCHGLTRRQLEVARLTAAGRTYREVATALGISPNTVKAHLRGAYAVLGVHRRAELARRELCAETTQMGDCTAQA